MDWPLVYLLHTKCMAEYKKAGSCKTLIVTGCMAQRYKNEITEEVPEVDAVPVYAHCAEILNHKSIHKMKRRFALL